MSPQESIGHYRIVGKLGEGGMGAVYRATDTRLNRDVALKVLPAAFAEDAGRMQRFEREAQVLASLNHPNIAAIYGVEQGALVMELVEGGDLAGPLPVETVIDYARQMAVGLEAAHEKGIVHRDLKPANIKVTPEGVVKLLDFGLAKVREESAPSAGAVSPTMSPTISLAMTQAGMLLGTAAYMSPEQARGKPVDRRADIWAYGVVLYELLTGQHPHQAGETVADILAAIVLKDADLSALPKDTPPRLRKLIERCLRKDPKMRLRDIGDARLLLDEPEPEISTVPAASRSTWLPWTVAAVCLAIAAAAAGFAWKRSGAGQVPPPVVRFLVPLPEGATWPNAGSATQWVPSPDGRTLALIFTEGQKTALWIRPIGATAAHRLEKTDGANYPFWSPDGQSIGFFTEHALRKVSVSSGAVGKICDITSDGSTRNPGDGATWGPDDVIVFSPGRSNLLRVSALGGIPVPITTLDKEEAAHRWPQFLPDGRHFLYEAYGSPGSASIYVQEIGSPNRVLVLKSPMRAMWSPPGFLLFTREGTLFAQRMNPSTFQLEGDALSVAEGVQANEANGRSSFAVSPGGTLVYRNGGERGERQLYWRDRAGKVLREVGKAGLFGTLAMSPDGKSVALAVVETGMVDVWIMDLASGVLSRLTHDGKVEPGSVLVWSPDSKRLAISRTDGLVDVTVSSGKQVPITRELLGGEDWAPDGQSILARTRTGGEVGLLSLDGQFHAAVTTRYAQTLLKLSPDGKYVAYGSFESGERPEIYVAAFPSFSAKCRVSTDGGSFPTWSSDGKFLYYRATDGTLTEVALRTGPEIQIGERKPLFKMGRGLRSNRFGVSADHQRFLISEWVSPATTEDSELTVVVNWQADLKRP